MKRLRPTANSFVVIWSRPTVSKGKRLLVGEPEALLDVVSSEGRDPRRTFVVRPLGPSRSRVVWRCRP
jgi:hypothetical protein